ncbi:hypothetical protein BJ875DRAFT_530575 [Amylocarpus encephaloides]|uniref:Uncharacterized protein n=1 Tax=Amylocarpus encephaloides TaxID=45428 RepID=A0A9P7Y626_9HELO|nr:hypothetical protein BJ875DRAFT_530575 [Amylocarpus encephaloides]
MATFAPPLHLQANSKPQPCLEASQQQTGTVYDGNDDDCDLPPIEQLLYTTLQKEGFTTEDQRPKTSAFKVGNTAVERGDSLDDDNGSALGDNLGGSLGDPIMLLGGDDSSASEADADDGGPRAKRVVTDEGLPDSPETATDSTTPAPPSNPDGWHDIDDFLESAQNLASQENQPVHEDHLHTGRSSADEHGLEVLGSTLDSDPVNEWKSHQQELEQRDDGPQQGVNDLAAVVTTESVDNAHPSDEDESPKPALSPPCDPLPKSSHDEARGRSDSDSDNDKADPEDYDKEPRPMKRKRPSSSHDGPVQKKRKRYPKQKSTRQHRPHSKLHRHSSKSYPPFDQASIVTTVSSAEGRLPSAAPSAPQIMDTEMPSDRSNLGGSSSDFLPVLTEVTFRPCSQHCYSFTAVVREGCDGQGVSFSHLT